MKLLSSPGHGQPLPGEGRSTGWEPSGQSGGPVSIPQAEGETTRKERQWEVVRQSETMGQTTEAGESVSSTNTRP